MLHLLRRQSQGRPMTTEGASQHALSSHIFPRFLKRLRAIDRPSLLDLGPLTGANIEFFARLGCRVQVEDLLSSIEEGQTGEGPRAEDPRDAAPASPPVEPPADAGTPPPAAGQP